MNLFCYERKSSEITFWLAIFILNQIKFCPRDITMVPLKMSTSAEFISELANQKWKNIGVVFIVFWPILG